MFCKYCGNKLDNDGMFCSICGKENRNNIIDVKNIPPETFSQTNSVQMHWFLLIISIGLVLLSLMLALNLGENFEVEDVLLPSVLSLTAIGLSGYVFMATKKQSNKKIKNIFSIIILICSILIAVELCVGPLIGMHVEK